MKVSSTITALTAASLSQALTLPSTLRSAVNQVASGQNPLVPAERFLIELEPGSTQWVTEEDKWELRRQGKNFFDITGTPDLGQSLAVSEKATVHYPSKTAYNDTVGPLLKNLDKKLMRKHLEKFTSFHTRYYRSDYGKQSSQWLFDQVNSTLTEAGAGIVQFFQHPWGQNSIIATLPGKSEKTIVIGAHQDSINLFLPSILAAPGADDDGSGTVTILEALRVLLQDKDILHGKAENTVEFHVRSNIRQPHTRICTNNFTVVLSRRRRPPRLPSHLLLLRENWPRHQSHAPTRHDRLHARNARSRRTGIRRRNNRFRRPRPDDFHQRSCGHLLHHPLYRDEVWVCVFGSCERE